MMLTTMRRLSATGLLIGLSIACISRERINNNCEWTHDAVFPIDLRDTAHQQHLRRDADLREDLAIRYMDAHAGRVARPEAAVARDRCMSKLAAVMGEYHGVTERDIQEWTGRRNVMFDISVFLSFLVGFSLASRSLMRRLFNAWSFNGTLAVLACAVTTLAVSAAGGGAGALWAAFWEVVRIGNEHLSHRAGRVPWPYYLPSLFAAALVMCSLVAWREYRAAARRLSLRDDSNPARILLP
jgi:hypothetical protein